MDIRKWMHVRNRTFASNARGILLVGDWAADTQLQRAIAALADSASPDSAMATAAVYEPIRTAQFEIPKTYGKDLESARKVDVK